MGITFSLWANVKALFPYLVFSYKSDRRDGFSHSYCMCLCITGDLEPSEIVQRARTGQGHGDPDPLRPIVCADKGSYNKASNHNAPVSYECARDCAAVGELSCVGASAKEMCGVHGKFMYCGTYRHMCKPKRLSPKSC